MKPSVFLLASVTAFCNAATIILPRDGTANEYAAAALAVVAERALPNSPSGGYAPASVDCPTDRPTIRKAGSLSSSESAWLQVRRNKTVGPMISLLERASISGFDVQSYITKYQNNASALPNIGIAASGGGYRAMLNAAGFIAAADNRTTNSTGANQIGGLLQATTYFAGLSGGNWLVGSLYNNNFSTVEQLRDGSSGSSVWQFSNSILEGPAESGISILNTAEYYIDLHSQVTSKEDAGFEVSITDYWGRALSYQMINATDGGPAYTFSSIALADNFVNGDVPFPVVVSDSRAPGTSIISLNSTVFEFNPFEMGSWDPTTYAFAPVEYIGSSFDAGVIPASSQCVRGFDQSGFVMGTSSSLFNEALLKINGSAASIVEQAIQAILTDLSENELDIADYTPNPFYHFNNATNRNADSTRLTLVDGGEDNQNIPLNPLIQPERALDVIFAIDSSADTSWSWPNGSSLVATYERSRNSTIQNGTAFPSIPDTNTFINLGLNNRPTFFGCDASNLTGPSPLIVYIPNVPYITQSNTSTFQLSYNDTQRDALIQNAYDGATQGNGTLDSSWLTCVGCAILSRSFTKTGTPVPSDCQTCFTKYCWNGTLASQTPPEYDPAYKLTELSLSADSHGEVVTPHRVLMTAALGLSVVLLLA